MRVHMPPHINRKSSDRPFSWVIGSISHGERHTEMKKGFGKAPEKKRGVLRNKPQRAYNKLIPNCI